MRNNPTPIKGRSRMYMFVLDPRFQAGITDYRSGLPPVSFADPIGGRRYEMGRLFAAYLSQKNVAVPTFNANGALRRSDLSRLTRAFGAAWREGTFPP